MVKQRIFSIGFEFPGGEVDQHDFESDQSLLDADIVVFKPTLGEFFASGEFRGKPSFSETESFQIKEQLSHWRRELYDAFSAGKTIFVFLAKPVEVYLETGNGEYSGTGKNRQRTNYVDIESSYKSIPFKLDLKIRSGKEIVAAGELGFLARYWSEFRDDSRYEITISEEDKEVLLRTRSGGAVVAAALLGKTGSVIMLPPLEYDEDELMVVDKVGNVSWNKEAKILGRRLASALREISISVKTKDLLSPPPAWAQEEIYRLPEAEKLQSEIRALTEKLEELQDEKFGYEKELTKALRLKGLLYEQGHELERRTEEAIALMGFSTTHFQDEESEFDLVFTSAEGRFIGEVEGKDKRAINIDKFSQLARNLDEDFAKDEVQEFAHGVLFGNAFRLTSPKERSETFTAKCILAAKRTGIALVNTSDLFEPARYLASHDDVEYSGRCRKAIVEGSGGIIVFPEPPDLERPLGDEAVKSKTAVTSKKKRTGSK